MPVVPNKPGPPLVERNELVDQLAMELTREGEGGEPVIIEHPIQPAGKFFSTVVWSAWGRVPVRQRSAVILEAYQKRDQANPHEQPRAPDLAMATGLTWEEADEKGLFPYAVEPHLEEGESVDPQSIREALLAEGAVAHASGVRLRFYTRRAAQAAQARLLSRLPQVHWTLTEYVPLASTE